MAKAYYWHRFYSHQPDLNYDNPQVAQAMIDVIDFWLDLGVDGFRLDAVPYLYERSGTNCENLPETHAFIKRLRGHIDSKYRERVLLAEANQWPENAAAYFGHGDECHMAFHFPLMPRLFMSIRMEDRFPVLEILEETPAIPPSSQWALFLRNHDELTLEMVTDEERDYMYRVYARERQMRINLGIRRRLAPLLDNDRRKIELMNALLFSLPGTPVIYYGDEIGMGDNIYLGDRNAVRTPMQWSADRNAGFSRANPQKLYLPITIDPQYHYESTNVEAQQNNPHSLLRWMTRLIEERKQYKAFGRGTLEFLRPSNRKVLAFYRRHEGETILVIANLSRFPQHVELDLSEFREWTPVEVFGRTQFPAIGDQAYTITLGSLGFYWLSLETKRLHQESIATSSPANALPVVEVDSLSEIFSSRSLNSLLRLMPNYLQSRRWFLGKDRIIRQVEVLDSIPIGDSESQILIGRISYNDGDPENYLLPAAIAVGQRADQVRAKLSDVAVVRLRTADGAEGVIYGAVWNPAFGTAMLTAIARRRRFRGKSGELVCWHNRAFRSAWGESHPILEPSVLQTPQSNTSIAFGQRFILKLYRRVEAGVHPEIEVSAFLTEKQFPYTAPLTGTIEYRGNDGESMSIGALFGYVPNQGNARQYTLDWLSQFFEGVRSRHDLEPVTPHWNLHFLDLSRSEAPTHVHELLGAYVDSARLLGHRTAELHIALASGSEDRQFVPEAFTDFYRESMYHGLMSLAARTFLSIQQRSDTLPKAVVDVLGQVLDSQKEVRSCFRSIPAQRVPAMRIRLHDDLHLEQVLHTGKDFLFVGLECRVDKTAGERRIKRSPWRDVACMLLSFQYAAYSVLFDQIPGVMRRPEAMPAIESWAAYWSEWASAMFLKGYNETIAEVASLSLSDSHVRTLLTAFLVERSLEEIGRELRERPEWARIPARMLLRVLSAT